HYVWWPKETLGAETGASTVVHTLYPVRIGAAGMNEYDCRDTVYINVDVDYTMHDMVPNAFSPNGDGLNDVFRVTGITYQQLKVFMVFNRYGQEVFATTDVAKGWDGTYNGRPCEVGTYFYLIRLEYPPDGRTKTYQGDVQLLR